jgi:5-methylcytosine-specific restriction endonuclease McrA
LNRFRMNRSRLRLEPEDYRELSRQVLAREGRRRQECGTAQDQKVQHIRSRGRLGDDAEENLITLCAVCHRARHQVGHLSK